MSSWIRCADELPPVDTPVWGYNNGVAFLVERTDGPDGWLWAEIDGPLEYIDGKWATWAAEQDDIILTHWRPLGLPVPPEEK